MGEVSGAVGSLEEAVGVLELLRRSVEAAEGSTGKAYLKVLAVEFAPLRWRSISGEVRCRGDLPNLDRSYI